MGQIGGGRNHFSDVPKEEPQLIKEVDSLIDKHTAAFTGDGAAPGVILVILIGTQAGEIEIDGQKFAEFILPDKLF